MTRYLIPLCGFLAMSTCLQAKDCSINEKLAKIKSIGNSEERLKAYDALAKLVDSKSKSEDLTKWSLSEWDDAIDDTPKAVMSILSSDRRAKLVLTYGVGKYRATLTQGKSSNKIDSVVVRIDKNKARNFKWKTISTAGMLSDAKPLIAYLKGGKRMVVKCGYELYYFDMTGFDSKAASFLKKGAK